MSDVSPPRPLLETDDCGRFDCGRSALNVWLQRHAWANHRSGASRVSVLVDKTTSEIVAYVTLSASQIERSFLPKTQQRNRPDPLPTALLGQLAVARGSQGRGHAVSLLIFALKSALRASAIVGSVGVVTHPLDDGLRGFYARWGFVDLPFDPRRAMMARMVDIAATFTVD